MRTDRLLSELLEGGIQLWAEGDEICYEGPGDAITPVLREEILKNKATIVARLGEGRKFAIPSFAQQRLWFIDQLEQCSAAYNVFSAWWLRGRIELRRLRRTIGEIVRRHETLRTVFATLGDRPVQVIDLPHNGTARAVSASSFSVVDLERLIPGVRHVEAQRLATDEADRPFDLARGPLLRTTLFRLADDEHLLLLTLHHIIADGWSQGVFFHELTVLHEAFASASPLPLPEPPVQYAEFAAWQRAWLRGKVLEEQLAYWRAKLAGARTTLDLPTDRPRPLVRSYRGAVHRLAISERLTTSLRRLSREQGSSLYMILLAGFMSLLHRHCGQDDLLVGSPIANRTREEIEGLIGFFVNTLVMRGDLSGNPRFRELVEQVRRSAVEAYTHQDLPFEKVVEELVPERDPNRHPLFQVTFALQPAAGEVLKLRGVTPVPAAIEFRSARFDLELYLWEPAAGADRGLVTGFFVYDSDLFEATSIARLACHLEHLLREVAADPDRRLQELTMLSSPEIHQLRVEWTDTRVAYPDHLSIHQLFEAQVERTPDSVAVVCSSPGIESRVLSYRELDRLADRLANHLRDLGVGPGTLVGLGVERSAELIVALVAILKAGGAYVPLNPAYPQDRLAFMLRDAGISVLLTQEALAERLPADSVNLVRLERMLTAAPRPRGRLRPARDPGAAQQLAYVMYTSGSTGQPKGVIATHRGVVRLVRGNNYARLTSEEVFLQLAPVAFDASTLEIWGCLLNGGRLVVMPPQAPSLEELGRALKRYRVTTLWLTAGLFHLMVDHRLGDLRDLRQLLAGGDVLSPGHVCRVLEELSKGSTLINGYGPTECTTFTCCHPMHPGTPSCGTTPVAIGRPIANARIYVVDRSSKMVPMGAAGELWVAGDGLAQGYLNRPELTAERFVPNPFAESRGERLYRTGDLVRYLPDGKLEFLGRIDYQVKIRGFRIELGEIEAVLAEHPAVREAVVLARQGVGGGGERLLVAYAVPARRAAHEVAAPVPSAAALRAFLSERVPEYMVPTVFALRETLPLNANGKVDRAALSRLPLPASDLRSDPEAAFVAPRTPIEEILAGIWCQVLGLGQVGIHDNFFELGGHSLMATQVISRLRKSFQVELPLRQLFESPTVAGMARSLDTARQRAALGGEESAPAPPLSPFSRDRHLPLSFAQQRLWFLHQLEPASPAYNMPAAFTLAGDLNVSALERCFREIVRRHEVLRTTFPTAEGRPHQRIDSAIDLTLPIIDLSVLAPPRRRTEARRLASDHGRRPFDLVRRPPLRVALMRLDERQHLLLLNLHHIASDGWSQGVLYRELATLYEAFSADKPSPLPDLPIQYADFAVWQREWLRGKSLERQLSYWKDRLGSEPPPLRLPTDRPRPTVQRYRGTVHWLRISAAQTRALRRLSFEGGASLFMTLLAAFMTLLGRHTGQEDLIVGSPIANRNREEIEGLIGFFVNSLALRGDLSPTPENRSLGFMELLERIREVALGAYAHQDLPFEKLVEELQPERNLDRNPLFQVMFALQNAPSSGVRLPGLLLSPADFEFKQVRFDLEVHLWEDDAGILNGAFAYSTDLFDATTIARLASHFTLLLGEIAANPDRRLAELPAAAPPVIHQLLVERNDTAAEYPRHDCLHRIFAQQAARTPHAVAVEAGPRQLSYHELDHRADELADFLLSLGVGTETLVGVCLERSPEMIATLLGILKAGGAYVPLDPDYPRERLAFMLHDAGISVVLTQKRLANRLGDHDLPVVCLETIRTRSARPPSEPGSPQQLAYVMFTSGSTGRPKGVSVTHRGVLRLVRGTDYARLSADEVFLQLAPVAFDASTLEIWGPLLNSGRLVMMPPQMPSLEDLGRALRRHRITTLWLTAGLFHLMVDEHLADLEPVRQLLAGGDVLSPGHVHRVLDQDCRGTLINGYGPTECTTFTCCHPMRRGTSLRPTASVPIGRPIANTRIHLVDRAAEPVPLGVAGELWVGGDGLARGYLNRPELTAEKFVPNPFATEPGERLYRTGDLVRCLPDGNLEFLGRIDQQVKIRGFRIELGEIEAVLEEHPAVREAVVVVREAAGDELADGKRLVAYLLSDARHSGGGEAAPADWADEHVAHWQSLYEELYEPAVVTSDADGAFNIVGWNSSYTEQPIPAAEMREWLDATVARIASLKPRRVLEIGCGTGLLLWRIAPGCDHYLGTDFSPAVIDTLRARTAVPEHRLSQVELVSKTADDFAGIDPGAFDTVILNSVVQYFPNIDYFLEVLRGAVEATAPGGSIFVGDVRSLPLLEAFCASVELYQADGSLSLTELRERVENRLAREEELVIDPAFFTALRRELPRIREVRILPKSGRSQNELTRFRYDVVLRLAPEGDAEGEAPSSGSCQEILWLDWRRADLSLPMLRDALEERRPAALGLRRVPNRRLLSPARLVDLLSPGDERRAPDTVAGIREILGDVAADGVDPADLEDLGRELAYSVELSWSELGGDGCYDVLFWRSADPRPGSEASGVARAIRPWTAYANNPLERIVAGQLVPQLREHLKGRLPEHMLPAAFTVLESFPLSPTGKVDRAALGRRPLAVFDGARPELGNRLVAPRTSTEKALAAIWSEVLGVDTIGVHDNLFELGGDSILSIRIVAKANQEGMRLSPKDLFQHQTVAELAEIIGAEPARIDPSEAGTPQAGERLPSGPVPLTPIQHWFFERDLPEPWHFNQSLLVEVRHSLDPALLRAAVGCLLEHHDALRLRFRREGAGWRQIHANSWHEVPWIRVNLTAVTQADAIRSLENTAARLQASLDLEEGPICRFAFFDFGRVRRSCQADRLLIAIHHLAVDSVSWRILLADLERACRQLAAGQPVTLPPRRTTFHEWAERLAAHARSEELRGELDFWLARPRHVGRLETDFDGANTMASADTVSVTLGPDDTRRLLREVPTAYRTRIDDVLLTALARTLARRTGSGSLAVELEGHGREEIFDGIDLSRTVGWFTSTYPVVLELDPTAGDGDALKAVKEQLRAVPRRGIGHGLLRALCPDPEVVAKLRSLPQPEVSFNYLGQLDAELRETSLFRPAKESTGPTQTRQGLRSRLLEINGAVTGGRLEVHWTYSRNRHRRPTIEELAQGFRAEIGALIAHCLSPGSGGHTPSDFPLAGLDSKQLDRLIAERQGARQGEIEDVYPLSPMQQGMLFHALYSPESTVYFEQINLAIRTDVDIAVFRRAWLRAVERHAILRTAFVWEGLEVPLQIVDRQVVLPWAEHDWRDLGAERQQARLAEFLAADRERGFDLAQAPLMRLILVRLGDDRYRFIWSFHHLLLDGWSTAQLLAEVLRFWEAFRQGEEPELRRPRPYRDYIAWLAEQDQAPAERFWRRTLAGFTRPTPLVAQAPERGRGEAPAVHDQQEVVLPPETSAALSAFARCHQLTVNTLVQGAWALLLARMSGEDDVVFGVTVSGRPPSLAGSEAMIGLLINTVPLRVRAAARTPLLPWLKRIQEHNAEIRQYEYGALVDVQAWSEVPGSSPLFESLVVFENYPVDSSLGEDHKHLEIGDLEAFDETNYPLTLVAAPGPSGAVRELSLRLRYDSSRFTSTAARRMLNHLRVLVEGMVADAIRPTRALSELAWVTAAERHQLVEEWNFPRWNAAREDHPSDGCLHGLFAAQVERTPDAVALVCGDFPAAGELDRALSYRELDRRANRLAHRLLRLGAGPEVRIGLFFERSPEMVIGLLGILKSGGTYVPLDPSHPAERLAFVLEDAGVSVVVAHPELRERLPALSATVVWLDPEGITPDLPEPVAGASLEAAETAPAVDLGPENLAYIIYTSGSTGRPKGVGVTHANVVRLFATTQSLFDFGPDDVWTLFHSVAFDFSVWEIWGALLYGGRLVVVPYLISRSPETFRELMEDTGVTVLNQTPSAFWMLIPVDAQARRPLPLRWVIFGGEALDLAPLTPWFERYGDRKPQLVNMYGITETTVHVTFRPIRGGEALRVGGSPIGRQLPDLRLMVLDDSLNLAPVGVPGELYVAGAGLSRGYLGVPGMTAERFIPSPLGDVPGSRLYRTGDRVRLLDDGELEYLDRVDHQVQIRGHRIELGEIETALTEHPAVEQAVALYPPSEKPEDRRLVAHVILTQEESDRKNEAAKQTPTAGDLRRFLLDKLPSVMVPSALVFAKAFPLSSSGKVDRTILSRYALSESDLIRTAPAEEVVAPRTPVEEILAGIWAQVLGLGEVGVYDNFFELGGHSLMATQVTSRVRQSFRVDLPLRRLFEHPTIAELAPCVEIARRGEALGSAGPLERRARDRNLSLPLSFAQQRLWFLHQLEPASSAYNMPAFFRLEGRLDPAVLKACFQEIVRRHETLRTMFPNVDGQPVQAIAPDVTVGLPIVDLGRLPEGAARDEALCLAQRDAVRPFDLARGPVLRFFLLRIAPQEHHLLVNFHHITSDGWSLGVFYRELGSLYQAFSAARPSPLPDLPIQYADFAVWQRRWLRGTALQGPLSYWKKQLGCDPPRLRLPTDRPRPSVQSYLGAVETLKVSAGLTRAIRRLSFENGASLFMTLLAAFMGLLHRHTGQEDIVVGSPIANRNREEIEGLIGFFVNSLALRGNLSGNPGFTELLERIREVAMGAYTHQDLPFEKLVEELQPERDLARNPLFEVVFALQNAPSSEVKLPGLRLSPAEFELQRVRFDLEVHFWEADGELIGLFIYNTDLFDATTIARLAWHYSHLLEEIAANPQLRLAQMPATTPAARHQLLVEGNDTAADYPRDASVAHLFEAQTAATPDAVAMESAGRQLSYRELNRRGDDLAHFLRSLGVGPEERVGVFVERSPEMVLCLLGILKAGAAYVPLESDYPRDRLAFMLEDADISVLLTQETLAERLPSHDLRAVLLDEIPTRPARPDSEPPPQLSAENLAYVMYTSGSTGRPKGVSITHRGILRLVRGNHYARLAADEVFLQLAPVAFDASTLELWGCLLNGGRLVVMPPQTPSLEELGRALKRHRITTLWLTAGLFHLMVDERLADLEDLRQFLAGGDVLSPGHVRRVLGDLPECTLTNGYGPTECTTFTCCHSMRHGVRPPSGPETVPIGRPIANTRIWVVNRFAEPVPPGVAGELWVGGDGLARGYLNRPGWTAEKFIPNPFAAEPGDRLYRTGDLVRTLPDGSLEFLGRIDRQVKIRGFRIELGEIEAVLADHRAVREAVVVARDDVHGDQRLVAYLIPEPWYPEDPAETCEGWQDEHVAHWKSLYEDLYQRNVPEQGAPDPAFNIAGWNSSYTGQAIPAAEMREWVDNTVERILALCPGGRILEIGCGTGLLLFRIAPHADHYLGTDFSPVVLDTLRSQLASPDLPLPQVSLFQQTADDFRGIEAEAFDTVILNSVVQYFPSIEYLLTVLRGAVEAAAPGGTIFLGDLRSLPLHEVFCASVELFKAADSLPLSELRERVRRRRMQEEELVIDPAFFVALKRELPRIRDVRILPKAGRADNELTRFRYDVVLELDRLACDRVSNQESERTWLDWRQAELTVAKLRQILDEHRPPVLSVRRVPNRRLEKEVRLVELLADHDGIGATVAELRATLRGSCSDSPEPDELRALSRELPYSVELSWSELGPDGSYNLLFRRSTGGSSGVGTSGIGVSEAGAVKPWAAYANDPLRSRVARQLVPRLRADLQQQLPEYMVPAVFVPLEVLPLSPNGKVDRRALPAPDGIRADLREDLIPPRTPTEEVLAQIYSELLGVDRVGIRDGFFELGGHSLLAVRLMAQIEQRLAVGLPLAMLFRKSTIEGLAGVIDEREPAAAFSPLVEIQPQGSNPAFFCVHPGGGNVLCYSALSHHLGNDQPFYGFQSLGSDGGAIFDSEVPSMATRYCDVMRAVQPRGPYRLGGWSMGGVVAFEMARQLRADGEEVALLVLVDSAAPRPETPLPAEDSTFSLAAFAHDLGLVDLGLLREDRPRTLPEASLKQILSQAKQAGLLPADVDYARIHHLYRLFRNNVTAMLKHVPKAYDGKIVLLRPEDRPSDHRSADLGWSELAAGGVELATVPGNHFTMVREPHVRVLAERLNVWLRQHAPSRSDSLPRPCAR